MKVRLLSIIMIILLMYTIPVQLEEGILMPDENKNPKNVVTTNRVEQHLIGSKKASPEQIAVRDKHAQKFIAARGNVDERKKILKSYFKWYAKNVMGYQPLQLKAIDKIWTKESNWNWKAKNPNSSASGIAQLLNSADVTDPFRQIELGLKYIDHKYGKENPSDAGMAAYKFRVKNNWY